MLLASGIDVFFAHGLSDSINGTTTRLLITNCVSGKSLLPWFFLKSLNEFSTAKITLMIDLSLFSKLAGNKELKSILLF
ncbi:hypothetical protein BN433_2164 [Erwinia amylovora Ea266]|nr:hypothetical protein BN433_2164 [Erwinia amylovora Ea266]